MFYSSHVNREYQLRELIPHTYSYSNDNFFEYYFSARSCGATILRKTTDWFVVLL